MRYKMVRYAPKWAPNSPAIGKVGQVLKESSNWFAGNKPAVMVLWFGETKARWESLSDVIQI